MDQPTLAPVIPANKRISTGCIVGMTVTIVFVAVFALLLIVFGGRIMGKKELMMGAPMSALVIAIKGYQAEYNRFPLPKGQIAADSATIASSGPFLDALLNEASDINPRNVKFLDPNIAKNNVNGLLEIDGKRMVVDRWGKPYCILIDFDGDGKVPDPEHPGAMLGTTVIVFSGGPDGNLTTWQDNVTSWK